MQRHLKYSIYQNKIIFAPSKVHHFVLSVNITSIYTSPKSKRSYFWFLYHLYFLKSMNPQITWNNFSINISLYAQALPLRPLCLFLRFCNRLANGLISRIVSFKCILYIAGRLIVTEAAIVLICTPQNLSCHIPSLMLAIKAKPLAQLGVEALLYWGHWLPL